MFFYFIPVHTQFYLLLEATTYTLKRKDRFLHNRFYIIHLDLVKANTLFSCRAWFPLSNNKTINLKALQLELVCISKTLTKVRIKMKYVEQSLLQSSGSL